MSSRDLVLILKARDEASKVIGHVDHQLGLVQKSTGLLGKALGGLGQIGLAGMGISTLIDTAKGIGDFIGLGLASEMEQTRAQFMAYVKDGAKVDAMALIGEQSIRYDATLRLLVAD